MPKTAGPVRQNAEVNSDLTRCLKQRVILSGAQRSRRIPLGFRNLSGIATPVCELARNDTIV